MIQVNVDKLRRALILLEKVVPKKKAMLPITNNVLLHDGMVTGTDLETRVSVVLPEVTEDMLLPLGKALEMLKYVPGTDLLTVELEGNKSVKLSWGDGRATFLPADAKDYPPTPELNIIAEAPVSGDLLISNLVEMLGYAATDSSRPVLTGVDLVLGAEKTGIAGGDGFRLAFKDVPIKYSGEYNVVIASKTIATLAYLWKQSPARARLQNDIIAQITSPRLINLALAKPKSAGLADSPSMVSIQWGDIKLVSQLIAGNFPNYHQWVPTDLSTYKTVRFFAGEALAAIKRVADIAKSGSNIIRFRWDDAHMVIAATAAEEGDVETRITVQPGSQPGFVGLNATYIRDYLSGKDGIVSMSAGMLKDGRPTVSPVIFGYGNSPKVIIMPVCLNENASKEVKTGTEPETKEPENVTEVETSGETVEEKMELTDDTLLLVTDRGEIRNIMEKDTATYGDVKAKLSQAREQAEAWLNKLSELKQNGDPAKGCDTEFETAVQARAAWASQVTILESFLKEVEETPEDFITEPEEVVTGV